VSKYGEVIDEEDSSKYFHLMTSLGVMRFWIKQSMSLTVFSNYFFRHLFEEEANISGGQVTEEQTAAAAARDGLEREGAGNTEVNPVIYSFALLLLFYTMEYFLFLNCSPSCVHK
jgi:hypothetical protein